MTAAYEPLSREQLYDLVWREPMLKVGERFGVSSSYMARVCTALRVPRPERGYWAKLEFGKAPTRAPLPPAEPGDITQWKPGATVGTTQRAVVRHRKVRTQSADGKPAPLDRRHELLVGVKPLFLKTRDTDTGLLRPFKRLLVDIVASEPHLDATLNAADALFKALAVRGHRVMFAPPNAQIRRQHVDAREVPQKDHYHRAVWSPDRATLVYVGEVAIGLTLFEMTESVEMMYMRSSKYVPVRDLTQEQLRRYREPHYWRTTQDLASGRLALQAYSTSWRVPWVQRWQETKAGQFAGLISKFVSELEAIAPELARQQQVADRRAEEEHQRWLEEKRRAEEEAERARRVKARQDARQDLLTAIALWEQTRSIHAYFQAVQQAVEQLPEGEREHVSSRLDEARALIGPLDALEPLKRWKPPHER